jgi:hydrogenase expression/formation protein HypC
MKIERIEGTMAKVSVGSIKSSVSIQLIEKPKKGDYVLVHAGIAIEKVDRARAKEILSLITELGQKIDKAT